MKNIILLFSISLIVSSALGNANVKLSHIGQGDMVTILQPITILPNENETVITHSGQKGMFQLSPQNYLYYQDSYGICILALRNFSPKKVIVGAPLKLTIAKAEHRRKLIGDDSLTQKRPSRLGFGANWTTYFEEHTFYFENNSDVESVRCSGIMSNESELESDYVESMTTNGVLGF